jgi:hypothetical protein
MGGPSSVIQKQLSLGPMLHARRCASADGYSLGSSAGSSTIPCLQRSFGGRRDLPTAGRRRLQLAASDRIFPVTTARPGTQRARRSGFKTGAVLSISRHISCANGRHLLPHLAVIPRISREPKDVGRARRSYCL